MADPRRWQPSRAARREDQFVRPPAFRDGGDSTPLRAESATWHGPGTQRSHGVAFAAVLAVFAGLAAIAFMVFVAPNSGAPASPAGPMGAQGDDGLPDAGGDDGLPDGHVVDPVGSAIGNTTGAAPPPTVGLPGLP